MNTAEHTPGPWWTTRPVMASHWPVYGPPDSRGLSRSIAQVHDPYDSNDAVAEATARLIAAGPDVLAAGSLAISAVEALVWMIEEHRTAVGIVPDQAILDQARKAHEAWVAAMTKAFGA